VGEEGKTGRNLTFCRGEEKGANQKPSKPGRGKPHGPVRRDLGKKTGGVGGNGQSCWEKLKGPKGRIRELAATKAKKDTKVSQPEKALNSGGPPAESGD